MSNTVCMVSEYDCWFQPRKEILSDHLVRLLSNVTMQENGLIIEKALAEYRRGLKKGFNISCSDGMDGKGILLGTISLLNRKNGLTLPSLKTDAFIIEVNDSEIIIAGQDQQGVLYGVFRFLAYLAMGKIKTGAKISEIPATPLRMITHWDEMSGHVHRGYGGPSLFFKDDRIDYDPVRMDDYGRLLASVGINRLSLNMCNVYGEAQLLITEKLLPYVEKLASIFRPYGIRLLLHIAFAAPITVGKLPTADPLDPGVIEWWKNQFDIVYKYVPDMAGFLVKADSEFEPGPFDYGRDHRDGANMLADAIRPHGGELIWRAFVYNCTQDWRDTKTDRARAAYDIFMPLDGAFRENVILEIKHGPYDFQAREPVSPLFGALSKTRYMLELMVTQEYTGQGIDLCYLPSQWEDIMNFDTCHGSNSKMKDLLRSGRMAGVAAIPNVGRDINWTGHTLAQANFYGYGRMIWNPDLDAEEILREWSVLTFDTPEASDTVFELLSKSYATYEKYIAPFGICFMLFPSQHYDPCPEGYEFSKWGTYHRADQQAIGIDRSHRGTGYTNQYAKKNADIFADPVTCPDNLILFFHRLRYDFKMKNGETLLQNIYNNHFEGYEEVKELIGIWSKIKNRLDDSVYKPIYACLEKQLIHAENWRDVINTYFFRKSGIGDAKGRKIYD